ncbi:MAG TPA: HEPN domain-containing protein [Sedimentisphaerales bacterium]|nr:HEPN domain-containing protein [Sedimentisphaerales bacterium]
MTKSNNELVSYRLQRARETLADARILADAGRWNPCVNRLYYACFYAVSALLIQEGLSSAKHTGLRSLFNRHFVKTNKVPKDKARIFNDLFERRQEGDYVDFVSFEESQVLPWLPEAEAFVKNLADLIEKCKE